MTHLGWVESTLKVFTSSLSAEQIDRALGVSGTWSPADSAAGRVRAEMGHSDSGAWFWTNPTGHERPPEEHLTAMLDLLDERAVAVEELANDALIELNLFLQIEDGGGFLVEQQLVGRLARHPIRLVVSVQATGGGDAGAGEWQGGPPAITEEQLHSLLTRARFLAAEEYTAFAFIKEGVEWQLTPTVVIDTGDNDKMLVWTQELEGWWMGGVNRETKTIRCWGRYDEDLARAVKSL